MTPAATVSELLRPVDRYRSPIVWDLGLSALAAAIRAGKVSDSRPAVPLSGAEIGTRSDPPQSRVPMSLVNLDEARTEEPRVLNRLVNISPTEALGSR
jgi:hypothetical protein